MGVEAPRYDLKEKKTTTVVVTLQLVDGIDSAPSADALEYQEMKPGSCRFRQQLINQPENSSYLSMQMPSEQR